MGSGHKYSISIRVVFLLRLCKRLMLYQGMYKKLYYRPPEFSQMIYQKLYSFKQLFNEQHTNWYFVEQTRCVCATQHGFSDKVKRDNCVLIETISWEKRRMCWRRDTFMGKETPMSDKRHSWRKRDTYVGEETLLGEKRHLCLRRDTFRGKETLVQAQRYFWGEK